MTFVTFRKSLCVFRYTPNHHYSVTLGEYIKTVFPQGGRSSKIYIEKEQN